MFEVKNKITKLFESEGYVPPYFPLQHYMYDMIYDIYWLQLGFHHVVVVIKLVQN